MNAELCDNCDELGEGFSGHGVPCSRQLQNGARLACQYTCAGCRMMTSCRSCGIQLTRRRILDHWVKYCPICAGSVEGADRYVVEQGRAVLGGHASPVCVSRLTIGKNVISHEAHVKYWSIGPPDVCSLCILSGANRRKLIEVRMA
jgi:hypothetical protein